ncbi:MAG: YibE/F family protein [Nocardioidaceae bacterium]
MGHQHGYNHVHADGPSAVPVTGAAVIALLVFLAVCAIATVAGVVRFWPDQHSVDQLKKAATYAAPGVSFETATVRSLKAGCDAGGQDPADSTADNTGDDSENTGNPVACGVLKAKLATGPDKGTVASINVTGAVTDSGLTRGDTVRLMRVPTGEGQPASYSFDSVVRSHTLWWLLGAFAVVVVVVARLRGVLAMVGLAVGALIVLKFMLPALLSGYSGVGVALAGSALIMFVVLYLAHGLSVRTSAALAGTLIGIGITATIGVFAVDSARLSGLADDSGALLSAYANDISFQGLLLCAVIVAGLGVLNDVTITQVSAVWELRAAAPELSRRKLFTSAMRIGRDHIASTIYTIVFAYAGASLATLLLLSLYARPWGQLLDAESIAEEVVRTLVTAIGLVLAVPVTTAIAAATVAGPGRTTGRGAHAA